MARPTRLTLADVKAARRAAAAGNRISAIARDLDVHHETVAKAVYGETWGHVTKPAPLTRPQVPARARVNSKLTAEQVGAARRRYAAGDKTVAMLAAEYGVGVDTMRDALHGHTWATLEDPPPVVRLHLSASLLGKVDDAAARTGTDRAGLLEQLIRAYVPPSLCGSVEGWYRHRRTEEEPCRGCGAAMAAWAVTARETRVRAGMTLAEMAKAVGVGESAISRWESAKRQPPGTPALRWVEIITELDRAA